MRAATIPVVPLSPTATMMTEARMSVMSVIPLTGLVPTMAIALAATVVKRKVMTVTSRMATRLKRSTPPITSHWKKRKVAMSAMMAPTATVFMEMSFWVRSTLPSAAFLLPISDAASLIAPVISFQLLMMPITPAMAMPPMPMLLAYRNRSSGDAAAAVSPSAISMSGKSRAVAGTITHHTSTEPQQMMKAYFSPTIYPMPSTAALVLHLNTSLAFSATVSPHRMALLVKFSFHSPKVATAKSYRPPSSPAISKGLACEPPCSPLTRTCVLAVASGKGYFPCMSLTKYLRKGMRNRMPRMPPSRLARKTSMKLTVISGYLACRM